MGKLLRIASVLHTVLKLPSVLLTCCEMHRYYVWSTFFVVISLKIRLEIYCQILCKSAIVF